MNTFQPNQVLTARSLCDHDCIYRATVISRTAKTVTIEEHGERKTVKIHMDDPSRGEYCYPHGRYSMCAMFYAPSDVPAPALPEWMEEPDIERESAPFAPRSTETALEPENVIEFPATPATAPAAPERSFVAPVRHYTQQSMCFAETDLFTLR